MRTLSVDIETYSDIDLGSAGVYAYTQSPNFEILLVAYSLDGGPVEVFPPSNAEMWELPWPGEFINALRDPEIVKTAFNAQFERVCLNARTGRESPAAEWQCTMVKALMAGLPNSLDAVSKALNLEQQKDADGKRLIRLFSCPNKEGRRNQSKEYPEDWKKFREYCRQDVAVEMEIAKKLKGINIESKLYTLDQAINDRGVLVDYKLVNHAIECDRAHQEHCMAVARDLTSLDNPKSVQQLKGWLEEREGITLPSLDKEAVKLLLGETTDPITRQVLSLRVELAKTSIKKYQAMVDARGTDDRVRGLLQFYGAGRTGRWAGRLVQVQNLPQNKLPDLDEARRLLLDGQYEMIEMLHDSVPAVLSQLIRTAFIAPEGKTFAVADFSAIEARVIAWLAGEVWRLKVFSGHGKIYEASAAQMFNVPIESIGKGSPLRQKGKVAELACIAEGQLVLTDAGLVPIEMVNITHRLWDGEAYVNHGGTFFKGYKDVIEYGGLTATTDHLVWVMGESEPIQFGVAATSGAHLAKTGDGRRALRLGENNKPRKTMERQLEPLLCANQMCTMRSRSVDYFRQLKTWVIKGLPELFATPNSTLLARQKINSSKATLRKYQGCRVSKLRRSRYKVYFCLCQRSWGIRAGKLCGCTPGYGDGSDRQQRRLCAGEYSICNQDPKPKSQKTHNITGVESSRMAVRQKRSNAKTSRWNVTGGNNKGSRYCCRGPAEKLALYKGKARVYDIFNAGPHNRFTVSGHLVHNCGYGGSVGALVAMGALKMGLTEAELPAIIRQWRNANPAIVKLWYDVEEAVLALVQGLPFDAVDRLGFSLKNDTLWIALPSGRKLAYYKPRPEPGKFGKNQLTYEGNENGKWGRVATFGGKIVENIVQAIARDCLAEAMMRVESAGYCIIMHVHDEIIVEALPGEIDNICQIMGRPIAWADGLSLRADGYETEYYRKD